MMTRILLSHMIVLICLVAQGQTPYADSLYQRLKTTTKPIERFEILDRIELDKVGFQATNVDSAACIEMVQIAQSLGNDSLLAISYNWIGSYFGSNKGDNATSLEYLYKALPYAMKVGDLRRISSIYFDMAFAYFDLGDLEAALESNLKGKQYIPPESHPLHHFMKIQFLQNMTFYHVSNENPDSAFYYSRELKKTNEHVNSIVMSYSVLLSEASYESLYGNVERAEALFKQASNIEYQILRNQSKLAFYQSYLDFLIEQGRATAAISVARDALSLGAQRGNSPIKAVGARYLKKIYEGLDQIDSAYFYSQQEAEINALINSQDNRSKIQSLAFNEELRLIEEKNRETVFRNQMRLYGLLFGTTVLLVFAFILFRNNRQKKVANQVLKNALSELKTTQGQLIHSEKMASLGELTAGIAHEIQNPLNFVNNFSDLNKELIVDLKEAVTNNDQEEVKVILTDLEENERKVTHHGKRAGEIVKSMLQHSRSSSGDKELTDINALCDEYLRLAYHGLRAKDKSFNAVFESELDPSIPRVKVVPQDIGRVLLNLINNAFQAVHGQEDAQVTVATKRNNKHIQITVTDNGSGISEKIKDKIFQPFFTTKPTGEGTGLGLSMSYDIVTKGHGGTIEVASENNKGTKFKVLVPLHNQLDNENSK